MTDVERHHHHHLAESHYADPTSRHPITMQQPETAKNITVYMNGDKYSPGRRFVVNRRYIADFDGFLNMVTTGLKPAFGAVRNIYTPHYGHKVTALDGLNNGVSVVAGGVERFRRLQYQEIAAPSKRLGKPRNDYASIRPVYHNTRMNVAARWKDISKGPCSIYVYGNGDINGSAVKLLLTPRIMARWDMVLQEVTDKLAPRTCQACRRLVTMHGELVSGADQLENGQYYVAVGNERFKKLPYGERAQHMAMMSQHTKKHTRVQLPPIRKRARTLNSTKLDDSSYSQKYAARKQMEEERTQQSQPPLGASRPQHNRKLKPIRGPAPPSSTETESVFHAKPVKVKRSGASGKLTEISNLDDEDDVFRAKREEIKAEEVDDDEDTKVDLPIDQVPADTVEEEEDLDVPVKHEHDDKPELSPSPPPKQTYATRLDEDDSEPTEPSKTPTSASREGEQPSERPEEGTEPNGSVVEPPEEPQLDEQPPSDSNRETEAAVAIQSAYKGYRVRRDMKLNKAAALDSVDQQHAEEDIVSPQDDAREPKPRAASSAESAPDETPPEEEQHQRIEDIEPATKESSRSASPEPTPATAEQPPELEESRPVDQSTELANDQSEPQPSHEPEQAATELEQRSQSPAEEGQPEELPTGTPHEEEQNGPVIANELEDSPDEKQHSPDPNDGKPEDLSTDQPNPASKPEDLPVDASSRVDEQSVARSGSRASAADDVTNQEEDDTAGLPERDDGDGIEESNTEQREPIEEATLNGSVPIDSQDVKPSQDSASRPGSLTPNGDGGQSEHVPKAPPEAEQIPNGQPPIAEGGV